mmetsp:Transcript_10901/g.9808  ORF Transcript_10901/g.9808 Transcript_10901/m.9808 type:complete len:154 (-) Transcript_10901:44-505(-)
MDLMGEDKLDIADFTSGIMNVVMDYDDIMEDAELLFETLENLQDDMGSIKIENIVDAIMLNKDDGAAKNIKQQIMIGLKLNEESSSDDVDDNDDNYQHNQAKIDNDFEHNMPDLYVAPKEIDPNQEPYKPIYTLMSAGRQVINSGNNNNKKTE